MNFSVKKIENCFADSRSYEYTLPVSGDEFLKLTPDWEVRINDKLRRSTAVSQKGNVIIKFILAGNRFRVSFPQDSWEREMEKFEIFLEKL